MNVSIELIFISLMAISLLLFILSFFKRDKVAELEKQVEHLTLQVAQENYVTKKKLKLLEEELIGTDNLVFQEGNNAPLPDEDTDRQKEILDLLQRGYKNE